MFELDLRSRLPIYEQLVEKFKNLIINEVLKPYEQLPSVRSLSKDLTINPNTIQKAYRELERQGYICSIPGKGSFVNEFSSEVNTEKMNSLKRDLEKIISELIFMGIGKKDILSMVDEIEENLKGGKDSDNR